ncbi:MAG: hypothetical protein K5685_10925, partial [Bacteroidales bacterium]|nr:hypothetical protein [Bacteroidales bacterium]
DNVSVNVVSGEYPNANAGSYTVELTLELDGTDKANYKLANNNKLNVSGEITQAELSLPEDISSYVETEKTYDGTTTAEIINSTYETSTITSATFNNEYANDTKTITVNFQLSATGNYYFKNNDETVYTTSKTYSGKITPVKLSSSILADNLTLEKEYDGGVYVTLKNGNTINGESGNLLSCNGITGETVQFYFSAAAYDEANIGERLVTVQPQITSSNYVFDSSDDDDNDDEVFAFNARITPKPVTVTEGITAKSKVYDGTTAAELDLSNIVISGVITGETAPEITATGEFEDANAGENKTVNITMQIAENSNYVLSETGNQTTTTGEITRKVITTPQITIQSDYDFVYDGQPKTPTVTVALDGQEIDLSEFTLTFRNNTNAGTATVTVSTSEGGNYELSNDHIIDFTIEKAEATTITTEAAPIENLMYDGTPKTLITAAQSPDGEIVYRLENETEFSKELPSATAAGRYTVYYKIIGDENHTDSKEFSVEATIIPQNMEYTLGQNASVQLAVFGEFTFTSDNENITVENVNGEYFLKTNSNVKDGDKATVKSDMHIISVSIINPMKNLNIESEWTNGDVKLSAPDMSGFDEDCSLYINGHKVENIDNEVISEEGENKVEYEIKDQNDNVVANQEIIIKIDKTAPITVAKAESQQVVYELKVGLEIAPKYFFIAGAVAMFEATDALSGIANAEMSWDNQNDFHAFDLKDVVNLQSGKHTLYVKISDNAGNSTIYNAEFMIFDESKFSNGSNSQKSPATYYGAELPEPQSLELQLNNNTIYAVKDLLGNVFLASQSGEITIEGNKINISEEYLKKVSPDNNKLYIYINPLGQQAWKDDLSAEEYESQILVYEFDIKYEVKINDDYKFFSEENSDLQSFCNGDKVSMTLSLDESFSTADYISIPALGISKVEFSTKLSFVVPSGTLHGGNEKLVVEFFKNNFSSTDYVNFPADYPSENNIRVYDDVLAIDNGLHTIEDGSYIWYMDSKELQGENLQFLDLLKYLTDNQTHTFYVSVVDKNSGIRFRVCPSEDFTITPISKRKAASVNVYPNPAESNKTFYIELDDFSEEYFPRTEIIIYNQLGTLVKKISDVEKVNPVSLNAGFYSGTVLISGKKVLNFKIIVK